MSCWLLIDEISEKKKKKKKKVLGFGSWPRALNNTVGLDNRYPHDHA
jgi:hypothetical protein